jgi:hypothetical protein
MSSDFEVVIPARDLQLGRRRNSGLLLAVLVGMTRRSEVVSQTFLVAR